MQELVSTLVCVLIVVKYELASLSWMLQKLSFALSFKDFAMPLSQFDISSRVDAL